MIYYERLNQYIHDLLALIHRDGGQYTCDVGLKQSVTDAKAKIVAWKARDDELAASQKAPAPDPRIGADTPSEDKDNNRCAICGWPLAESQDKGCMRGDCSLRPFPSRYYDAERARREYAPHKLPDEAPPSREEELGAEICRLRAQLAEKDARIVDLEKELTTPILVSVNRLAGELADARAQLAIVQRELRIKDRCERILIEKRDKLEAQLAEERAKGKEGACADQYCDCVTYIELCDMHGIRCARCGKPKRPTPDATAMREPCEAWCDAGPTACPECKASNTTALRETLAEYAHTAWSGWMKFLFEKCNSGNLYTMIIPAWFVDRWQRQLATPYADLSELEKNSDRAEADKILALLHSEPN